MPAAYAKLATTPSAHGPDYGFLWWLNTRERQYPGLPPSGRKARTDSTVAALKRRWED